MAKAMAAPCKPLGFVDALKVLRQFSKNSVLMLFLRPFSLS